MKSKNHAPRSGSRADRGWVYASHGGLAWRHTFADAATMQQAFAGGEDFTVAGPGPAADMAVVSASLDLDINAAMAVDVAYNGQLAQGSSAHSAKLALNARF